MKTIIEISEQLNAEQFVNSNYSKILGSWYAEESNKKNEERLLKRNGEIFIEQVDPEHNYGRSFKAYERYLSTDGIYFFQELSYGGFGINNYGFYRALSLNFTMHKDQLDALGFPNRNKITINTERCMANCKENRSIWRNREEWTLTQES